MNFLEVRSDYFTLQSALAKLHYFFQSNIWSDKQWEGWKIYYIHFNAYCDTLYLILHCGNYITNMYWHTPTHLTITIWGVQTFAWKLYSAAETWLKSQRTNYCLQQLTDYRCTICWPFKCCSQTHKQERNASVILAGLSTLLKHACVPDLHG